MNFGCYKGFWTEVAHAAQYRVAGLEVLIQQRLLLQEAYVKGVSAWNFDMAALKAEAEKESEPELPPIPEASIAGVCADKQGVDLQITCAFQ